MEKKCTKCNTTKNVSDFYKSKRDGSDSQCKECRKTTANSKRVLKINSEISFSMPEEEWRDIKGYEGHYKVSSHGRVKSLNRILVIENKSKRVSGFVLKPHKTPRGYLMVRLQGTIYSVHRLVASAFIPNPENKPEVNHIDRIKTNNRLSNLEWCTPSENMRHAWASGVYANKKHHRYNQYSKWKKENC